MTENQLIEFDQAILQNWEGYDIQLVFANLKTDFKKQLGLLY